MAKARFEVLINPTQQETTEREPLLIFSFYLSGRNNTLLVLSDEIIELLDNGFNNQINKDGSIERASTLLWLWTLGAYEVIRTICQAKKCFSPSFIIKADKLKKELAAVRMPSAKMEKQGKREPVNSNRSPDGWDYDNKDLLIGDPDMAISSRGLLKLYDDTLSSLTVSDILSSHADAY